MNKRFFSGRFWSWLPIIILVAGSGILFVTDTVSLLTPNQQAFRLYQRGEYSEAAGRFTDPMWGGVALFQQGEFEQATGFFAGIATADAAFNQGNALVMQGQYDAAVTSYERALEWRPEWEDASTNHDIALARAEMLRQEGGDMTGGMLGADEFVFTNDPSPPGTGEEQVEAGAAPGDEEMRAIWLRQVQTRPADFLAAKFAYQQVMRSATTHEQEVVQ